MEGCRPCILVKNQLSRSRDWDKYVSLVGRDERKLIEVFGITGFPTLVILEPDGTYTVNKSPSTMTKSYFEKLFDTIDNTTLETHDT